MRWLRWWAVAAVVLLGATAGVYAVAQQVGRRAADDVGQAISADSAARLASGADARSLVAGPGRELTSTSPPFLILYDAAHEILATDATVNGRTPQIPSGVLDAALARGSDHVTWQPASGVREAVYATAWQRGSDRGVVISGIGLGPTEDRTALVRTVLAIGWVLAVAGGGALLLLLARIRVAGPTRRPPPQRPR